MSVRPGCSRPESVCPVSPLSQSIPASRRFLLGQVRRSPRIAAGGSSPRRALHPRSRRTGAFPVKQRALGRTGAGPGLGHHNGPAPGLTQVGKSGHRRCDLEIPDRFPIRLLPSIGRVLPVLQSAGRGCPPGTTAVPARLSRLLDPDPIPAREAGIAGPATAATARNLAVGVVPYPPRLSVLSARSTALVAPPVVERVRAGVSVAVNALGDPGPSHAR